MTFRKGHTPWNKDLKGYNPEGRASFPQGHTPWNKGLKGFSPAGAEKGRFKKGELPPTYLPTGSLTIRIDREGNDRRWIKISDNRTVNDWVPYSQYLWEQAYGPIPEGFLVHHKDRDSLNDSVENYELVNRAEHMREHANELRLARLREGDKVGSGYIRKRI